jgi:hypothetical protein
MKLGTLSLCAAIAVFSLAPVAETLAGPPMTHALIHIRNDSKARATMHYKWGNGRWQKFVILPGRAAYFNHRYDGTSQRSPTFYVRMDTDSDKGVRIVEHTLTRGASPDDNSPRYGHHYVIKQLVGTDTRYIDAITPSARVNVIDRNSSVPR